MTWALLLSLAAGAITALVLRLQLGAERAAHAATRADRDAFRRDADVAHAAARDQGARLEAVIASKNRAIAGLEALASKDPKVVLEGLRHELEAKS